MKKIFQFKLVLQTMGIILGFVSFVGGISAAELSIGREPERYLVAAFILLCGAILWLVYSLNPKFSLSKGNYKFIPAVTILGLMLGLFYSFGFYGGECGMGFYHRYFGYPAYWLINSVCKTSENISWLEGNWSTDFVGFAADIFFWSSVGLIITFIRNFSALKKNRDTIS